MANFTETFEKNWKRLEELRFDAMTRKLSEMEILEKDMLELYHEDNYKAHKALKSAEYRKKNPDSFFVKMFNTIDQMTLVEEHYLKLSLTLCQPNIQN